MLHYTNNGSSDVIQSYLSYLQEMSRKITLRSGMENVLYRKTKKKYHYYLPADSSVDSRYLKEVKDHIDKEPDRKLFLGNGLVVGLITKKKTKKYIASPLLYFLVEIDTDDSGRKFIHEVEWDSVSLNYDLVTLILEKDSEEENQIEDDTSYKKQLINPFNNNAEIFEDIETELESYLSQEEFIDIFSDISTSRELFIKIKNEVEEFKQTVISEENFTLEQLDSLIKNEGLTFFSNFFFQTSYQPTQHYANLFKR
jgi:hypothetical protein